MHSLAPVCSLFFRCDCSCFAQPHRLLHHPLQRQRRRGSEQRQTAAGARMSIVVSLSLAAVCARCVGPLVWHSPAYAADLECCAAEIVCGSSSRSARANTPRCPESSSSTRPIQIDWCNRCSSKRNKRRATSTPPQPSSNNNNSHRHSNNNKGGKSSNSKRPRGK